jgi:hypothetical protein
LHVTKGAELCPSGAKFVSSKENWETFEKCSILFKVKSKIPDFDPGEGENSNHRNTFKYFEE